MKIAVISTGINVPAPIRQRCIESVAAQGGVGVEHIYIAAEEQTPVKSGMQNFYESVMKLDPDTIVAWVDGDDWLAHDRALARIHGAHERGAWVTYGNFVFADGRPSFATKYTTTDYRRTQWLATHLKTFRAGLVQRIDPNDLKIDGEWQPLVFDLAVMFPCMEMAGPGRVAFCPDVLYVYNFEHSYEHNADADGLKREREIALAVRQRKPYPELT